MEYTLRVVRFDKRYKSGEAPPKDYDYCQADEAFMREEIRTLQAGLYPKNKFRIELHETYVTKKNLMGGGEYKERFDTPHYCSPASESYWSM